MIKTEAIVKDLKPVYPRLMLHTPTGSVVLQMDRIRGVLLIIGPEAPSWSVARAIGSPWEIRDHSNYVPWVGKLTLENT